MKTKIPSYVVSIGLILATGAVVVATSTFKSPSQKSASSSALDVSIQKGEESLANSPAISKPYTNLASLYLQKVRETSDGSYYAKVDALMDTAARVTPQDPTIPALRASSLMGRHMFKEGYAEINKAIAQNATTAAFYGIRGDAEIELGLYLQAVASFQKMIDIRPDFSSWGRIAYIRELYGDIPGAKTALEQAIQSGSSFRENVAWGYVELGKLALQSDLLAADKAFDDALVVLPTYTPAIEGKGKVAFAKKDIQQSLKHFKAAYDQLPLAQYAIDLGDVYTIQGDTLKASQNYALAQAAYDTSRSSGIDTDLEESLFLSEHDLDLPEALLKAQRAYVARPSIYAADALSWAYYKNGNIKEALLLTQAALRLGKNDPLILYHQAIIAENSGNATRAKEYKDLAFKLNPHFSLLYSGGYSAASN